MANGRLMRLQHEPYRVDSRYRQVCPSENRLPTSRLDVALTKSPHLPLWQTNDSVNGCLVVLASRFERTRPYSTILGTEMSAFKQIASCGFFRGWVTGEC